MNDIELLEEAIRLHRAGTPFCAVTIVDARGSIPQEIGAKALVTKEGLAYGTIGGGNVEARSCERARELLTSPSTARTQIETINLHKDLSMACAGEMTLYYEVYRPELDWNIVVFGAGHVAQKLCRLLIELDCRIVCIDTRPEWIERLPRSDKLVPRLVTELTDGIDALPRGAFILVMTMGHATDIPVLHALCKAESDAAFVGVLGSDAKAAILRRQLRQSGLPDAFIDRIQCPIGEKFGDHTPSEIAVCVLAELVKLRRAPSTK